VVSFERKPIISFQRRSVIYCWYASHTIVVVIGTLTPCLENSSIIPCGCLMFYQFCHLVYPFATAYFHKLSSLLQVHPSLLLICEGVLPLAGAPLDDFTSMLFVRSGNTCKRFYLFSIFNQHRFSSSALAPVCKSRRLYPGCS
jgi:hypothetical protein